MNSSKIILVGAISVVFGLYTLSLTRVNTYVGKTAENTLYISKANENAKTGVQRSINIWARGGAAFTQALVLMDGTCNYTVVTDKLGTPLWYSPYAIGDTVRMTITSHGYYKAPGEQADPKLALWSGHEVVRTASAKFRWTGSGQTWYDVMFVSAYSTVNYTAERQLDSLQQFKNNLVGY